MYVLSSKSKKSAKTIKKMEEYNQDYQDYDYDDDDHHQHYQEDFDNQENPEHMEMSSSGSFDSRDSDDDSLNEEQRIEREANGYGDDDNAFKKAKIDVKVDHETGMTEILIQDESFTMMQPLVISNLQNDPRVLFAGYRATHCLNNEILLKVKCVEGCTDSAEDCFRDSLQTLLKELEEVETLCIV